MKRLAVLALSVLAACRAVADGPWISVGDSGPVGPSSEGWTDGVRTFAVDEGSAFVVKGDAVWELRLDAALVSRTSGSGRPCGIGFDGGPDGLGLEVLLSGENSLSSGGIDARNCPLLAIRGPGSLSVAAADPDVAAIAADGDLSVEGAALTAFRSGTDPEDAAVVCGGDLSVDGSVVAVLDDVPPGGGSSALRAEGTVSLSRSAAVLLGSRGIRAESVLLDGSVAGICTSGEAVLADDSFVAEGAEGLLFSDADAVSAASLDLRAGHALSIVGNAAGSGGHAAVRQTSGEGELVHSGGTTALFAPGGTGIDAAGTVLVEGGELRVAAGPDGAEALSFFSADSVAAAAETVVGGGFPGDDAFAALRDFFGNDGVVAFLAGRPAPLASDLPETGVRAAGVRFEGGRTDVSCRTDAAGVVSAATASLAGGTVAVNGAEWFPTVTVSFDANGGGCSMARVQVRAGTAIGALPAATRSGCVFLGWFTARTGGEKATAKTVADEDMTLYARWAKSSYKVVFDANGGTGRMPAQRMSYGKAAKLSANRFSRKGFVFIGWARTKKGAVAFKDARKAKNLTTEGGAVTLFAKWARKSYVIRFVANGGKGKMAPISVQYGKARSLPANRFHRGGWMFLGWARSKKNAAARKVDLLDGQSVKTFVASGKTVTLRAVWKRYRPKTAGRIRFALCQTPCGAFPAKTRIDKTFDWARQSLRGDEDVIVFPELAFATFSELKTAWRKGPKVWETAADFAREREAYVLVNHPNRPGGGSKMYNETRVFAPDGSVVAVYRKRVLAKMDVRASFSSGPAATPAKLPFAHLGILICKDAFTPSKGGDRYKGADILLVQFAHPGVNDRTVPEAKGFPSAAKSLSDLRKSRNGWRKLGKPYMAVNKAGPDGNYTLCGGTFAAKASGKIVSKAKADPKVVFADFPLRANGRIRPTPLLP